MQEIEIDLLFRSSSSVEGVASKLIFEMKLSIYLQFPGMYFGGQEQTMLGVCFGLGYGLRWVTWHRFIKAF